METWFVPKQMSSLAGSTVNSYGYDNQNTVSYCFNSLGFRSPEPSNDPSLVVVGNSISFGIGLDISQTYGSILANKLNRNLDNRSVGCYFHENHDHLVNINQLSQQDRDLIFIIQINNLDRQRQGDNVVAGNSPDWCIKRFLNFFEQVESLLKHRPHKYLYWDNVHYDIPISVRKSMFIDNKFHLDTSIAGNRNTFGSKSHAAIARALGYVI